MLHHQYSQFLSCTPPFLFSIFLTISLPPFGTLSPNSLSPIYFQWNIMSWLIKTFKILTAIPYNCGILRKFNQLSQSRSHMRKFHRSAVLIKWTVVWKLNYKAFYKFQALSIALTSQELDSEISTNSFQHSNKSNAKTVCIKPNYLFFNDRDDYL